MRGLVAHPTEGVSRIVASDGAGLGESSQVP